jgi:hypothetical protein
VYAVPVQAVYGCSGVRAVSDYPHDGPLTLADTIRECETLAAAVNHDMPGATLAARTLAAMKRCKGGLHPKLVQEALLRTPAAKAQ